MSLAVAAGVVVWLAATAEGDAARPVRYVGVVALVVIAASLLVGAFAGVAAGILLLGVAYATILVIDDPPLDGRAAVVGAALLVVGELAHLSIGARSAVTHEAGAVAGRVAFVAVLAFGAMLLGGVVLAVADLLRTSGIAIELVGVGAAVAAVGLLVVAARDARLDGE